MPAENHSGIGKELRQARKDRDLSIEEVAWRTRIRPEVLRALEKEHFSGLGHHAFVRTLLRTYSRTLGVDPAQVSEQYRNRFEPAEPSSLATLDEQRKTSVVRRPRFRWVHAAALAAVILLVASAVGVLRGPGGQQKVRSAAVNPNVSRIDRLDAASRSADRRAEMDRPLRGVSLGVVSADRTYVNVSVDGTPAFEGLLSPGSSRYFSGSDSIQLRTTSAKTLRMWVNGSEFQPPTKDAFAAVFGPSGQLGS